MNHSFINYSLWYTSPLMALSSLSTDLLMCCPLVPTEVLDIIQLRIHLMTADDITDINGYIIVKELIDKPILDDSGWNSHGINLYCEQLHRLVEIQDTYLTDDCMMFYDNYFDDLIAGHRADIYAEKRGIVHYDDKFTVTGVIHNLIQTQLISNRHEYDQYIQHYTDQLRKITLSQNYVHIQNQSSQEVYVFASTKCLDDVIIKNHELIFETPHNGVRLITKLAPRTQNLCETLMFNPRHPRCYVTIDVVDIEFNYCQYNRVIQKGKLGVITDTLLS